jgi:hypothetical protein
VTLKNKLSRVSQPNPKPFSFGNCFSNISQKKPLFLGVATLKDLHFGKNLHQKNKLVVT